MNTPDPTPDDAATVAFLFTEEGGDVLDRIYYKAIGLCTLAGAVRADRLLTVKGNDATKRHALDHLVNGQVLRELTPPGTEQDQRVFVLG